MQSLIGVLTPRCLFGTFLFDEKGRLNSLFPVRGGVNMKRMAFNIFRVCLGMFAGVVGVLSACTVVEKGPSELESRKTFHSTLQSADLAGVWEYKENNVMF